MYTYLLVHVCSLETLICVTISSYSTHHHYPDAFFHLLLLQTVSQHWSIYQYLFQWYAFRHRVDDKIYDPHESFLPSCWSLISQDHCSLLVSLVHSLSMVVSLPLQTEHEVSSQREQFFLVRSSLLEKNHYCFHSKHCLFHHHFTYII